MKIQKASKENKPTKTVQGTIFGEDVDISNYKSKLKYIGNYSLEKTLEYYDKLNNDESHYNSNDDVCTPMNCVKIMIDYLPDDLWNKKNLKILEPCAGNGNFGAYCKFKTNIDNIWFNELNIKRFENCKKLLKPKNIRHDDFFCLDNEWANDFDLIVANPPYSGGGNKNQSLSNKFIEKSIDMLKDGGFLCYVTPNNWMTYNSNNTTLKKLLNEGSFLDLLQELRMIFISFLSLYLIMLQHGMNLVLLKFILR